MTHPLKAFRNTKKQTLEAFGKLLGVQKGTVSKWENGKAVPRKGYVEKITQITNGKVKARDFYEGAQ